MAGKEHRLTINFSSTKGYPMRVMIDRSAAKVMKSGESYSVSLPDGDHEVMLSVSIRKKPVMLDLHSDTVMDVSAPDVYSALTVDIRN
jgi:hypothetical protein